MMCMVDNPVGVSGNTGRVDFEESCEVVDYQLKSGLEVRGQQKGGMFLTTRKDMRELHRNEK